MASFLRVLVLLWADVLAVYAIWVMMTYLTDVWKLNVTHAAAILNIFGGVASIMPIGMAFIVDSFVGDYAMLLLSSIAYCIGLGFLSMSTPPVTGKCNDYIPECIGDKQRVLFYAALALIAVGISGHAVSFGSFFQKQLETDDEDESQRKLCARCVGIFGVVIVPIIGGIALPYINPWSVRFGIPAIVTVVATLLFLSGSCSYRFSRPEGSPITTIIRVFVASTSKLFYPFPVSANQLYEEDATDLHVNRNPGLSCLEKAAVILPSQPIEQQRKNRWRLCTVSEVEETKSIIRMIPMWLTFIMCGIVSSIGNTYFLEQAKNMNPKLGSWKVPLPILLMFYDGVKAQFVSLFTGLIGFVFTLGSRKYAAPTGIAVAMIFSVLCCITAAKVETRRLDVIRSHGLIDKPDERIPMTMFWLLPQFLLLGALDGIFGFSIDSFFKDQAPSSMRSYLIYFTNGVVGLGVMGSVVTVYVVGKISERGGKLNWFQDTLNKSRLDNYYWTLAALSAANLLLYIVIATCWFTYRNSSAEDDEDEPQENGESAPPYEDNTNCFCCLG